VEKVSGHGTIGSRKFFEFIENIFPRKRKIVERGGSVGGKFNYKSIHLNSAIVYKCIRLYNDVTNVVWQMHFSQSGTTDFQNFLGEHGSP
jgi:hypothetical protein